MNFPFRKQSKKAHWFRWLFALCLPFMLFLVLYGNGGLAQMYTMHMELEFVQGRIDDLESENSRKRTVISRVRNNPNVAKHMASKRALVAPEGSIIYRFHPKAEEKNPDQKVGENDGEMRFAIEPVGN
jgi:hypothetical protein